MLEFEVQGRQELAAAILAAAHPTYEQARANPVLIKLLGTSCRYLFREGLHQRQAEAIASRVRKAPAGVFK